MAKPALSVIVNVDGGSRGNPGPAAAGVLIRNAQTRAPLYQAGIFIGRATNNVAEYKALVHALEKALEMGATDIQVLSDSELLVRQMTGVYRVRHSGLIPLYESAMLLTRKFRACDIKHVRREENADADAMANKAMDAKRNVVEPCGGDDAPAAEPAATLPAGSTAGSDAAPTGPQLVLCQSDIVWEDKDANFSRVAAMLGSVALAQNSLVVLPEMFATGFSMNLPAVLKDAHRVEEFLAEQARKHSIYLMAGLGSPAADGKGRNEAVVFDPKGRGVARFAKLHPFSFEGEQNHYLPGERTVIFEWNGLKVAPLICYDLRFPEVFRSAVLQGAQLIVVMANWPASRLGHWLVMLQSRAIENLAYVAGVNRCGRSPHQPYAGRSMIVDPRGQIVAAAQDAPCLIRATPDVAALNEYRRQFPALADIRGEYVNDNG